MTGDLPPTSVFLVPHQDDETISMGAVIAQAATEGRRVVVVLVTDGRGSSVFGRVRRDDAPRMTRSGFSSARNRELKAALYGLTDGRYELVKLRIVNGTLTDEIATSVVRSYADAYPAAEFWTTSSLDAHPEHAALGLAVETVASERPEFQAREAVQMPAWAAVEAERMVWNQPDEALAVRVRSAVHAYKHRHAWGPRLERRYGIGWMSVPGLLSAAAGDPRVLSFNARRDVDPVELPSSPLAREAAVA